MAAKFGVSAFALDGTRYKHGGGLHQQKEINMKPTELFCYLMGFANIMVFAFTPEHPWFNLLVGLFAIIVGGL